MVGNEVDDDNVLRMNVRLDRDEYPELFNELKKVSKGMKRTQRLKMLASERLLLAGRVGSPGISASTPISRVGSAPAVREDDLAAAHELFLPPIK